MIVTYYYPWGYFYPARSGADTMACRHLEYFRGRGLRPRIVLANAASARRAAFERHYHWAEDIIVVNLERKPEIHRLLARWDFGSHLAGHALLAECPDLKAALSQPAEIAFINYVFGTPLLDALPRSTFRVLESVDVMSHQYVQQKKSPALFRRLLATEFALYDLYDLVLMINKQEEALAQSRCRTEVAYVARPIDLAPLRARGKPSDETWDLLFVGSSHPPNVDGVNWFYSKVFQPLLQPVGLRWAVVGSVCDHLSIRDSNVDLLGTVDNLTDIYERSKVVVVPLFRGAGVSIKTLEALGQRKPVVTTACGQRGLPDAGDALVSLPFQDRPGDVAQAILALCSSESQRDEYGRRAAAYIARHFSPEAYNRRMDQLLSPLACLGEQNKSSLEVRDDSDSLAVRAAA